jgi:hypothetical protein
MVREILVCVMSFKGEPFCCLANSFCFNVEKVSPDRLKCLSLWIQPLEDVSHGFPRGIEPRDHLVDYRAIRETLPCLVKFRVEDFNVV